MTTETRAREMRATFKKSRIAEGHTRYTVSIDGRYVGWVCKDSDKKEWNAYATSDIAPQAQKGQGWLVGIGTTRREAVAELEYEYSKNEWRYCEGSDASVALSEQVVPGMAHCPECDVLESVTDGKIKAHV